MQRLTPLFVWIHTHRDPTLSSNDNETKIARLMYRCVLSLHLCYRSLFPRLTFADADQTWNSSRGEMAFCSPGGMWKCTRHTWRGVTGSKTKSNVNKNELGWIVRRCCSYCESFEMNSMPFPCVWSSIYSVSDPMPNCVVAFIFLFVAQCYSSCTFFRDTARCKNATVGKQQKTNANYGWAPLTYLLWQFWAKCNR